MNREKLPDVSSLARFLVAKPDPTLAGSALAPCALGPFWEKCLMTSRHYLITGASKGIGQLGGLHGPKADAANFRRGLET